MAMNAGQAAFNHLAQVQEQMPPTDNLNRNVGAQGAAAGILGGTVAGAVHTGETGRRGVLPGRPMARWPRGCGS